MEINTLTVSELRKGLLKKDFTPKEILDSTIKKIDSNLYIIELGFLF